MKSVGSSWQSRHTGSRHTGWVITAGLLLVALTWLTVVQDARAGRYHVFSCRTPSGQVAPTDGWSSSFVGSYVYAVNSCPNGGALDAEIDAAVAQPTNLAIAKWSYSTPTSTSVAAATLWRYGGESENVPNATGLYSLAGPHDAYDAGDVFDQCVGPSCTSVGNYASPLAGENRVVVPAANAAGSLHLYASSACAGAPGYTCPSNGGTGSPRFTADVHVSAADITLEDDAPPSSTAVAGALASASSLTGLQDIGFHASDAGSGLYAVIYRVDGRVVSQAAAGDNGGRCQDTGGTSDGLRAFLYGQPCELAADVHQLFNSAQAPDGQHELTVSLSDAAGNEAKVLDRVVRFANGVGAGAHERGPGNGSDPSDQAQLRVRWSQGRGTRLESGFGQGHRVVGRLTAPGGHAISGAAIEVLARPSLPGARRVREGRARTGNDGRFVYRVTGGSSRTLRFRYRSHLNDIHAAAVRSLQIAVHAGLQLTVTPLAASQGSRIFFSGMLAGRPMPRGGKQLILEARQPGGGWIQFRVVRTDGAGRFRSAYRFRLAGPARYQFRVLSRYEAAFPYVAGTSNVVGVTEH